MRRTAGSPRSRSRAGRDAEPAPPAPAAGRPRPWVGAAGRARELRRARREHRADDRRAVPDLEGHAGHGVRGARGGGDGGASVRDRPRGAPLLGAVRRAPRRPPGPDRDPRLALPSDRTARAGRAPRVPERRPAGADRRRRRHARCLLRSWPRAARGGGPRGGVRVRDPRGLRTRAGHRPVRVPRDRRRRRPPCGAPSRAASLRAFDRGPRGAPRGVGERSRRAWPT